MQVLFKVEGIVSSALVGDDNANGAGALVTFRAGDDDVTMHAAADLLCSLAAILTSFASMAGGKAQVQASMPTSFNAGLVSETPGQVVLVFNQATPQQQAFVVSADHARQMGHILLSSARQAEQAVTKAPKLILPSHYRQ